MAKVYVSSTIADLKPERQAVLDWLRLARHQAVDSYLPDSDTVRDSCLEDVAACDLYVLILGHRYGFQPPDHNPEGLSITQLEFRQAGAYGIPRIALLRTSIPDVRLSDLQDPVRAPLVLAFRDEVASKVRAAEFVNLKGLIEGLSTGVQGTLDKLDKGGRQAGRTFRLAPRPVFLAGREELLAELDARLARGDGAGPRVVALTGLGGAGKTSVALEYAHRHLGGIAVAWQFPAQDAAVLAAGLGELAAQLGAAEGGDPVAAVHGALAASPLPWLLVFDNAPDRASVARFVPPAGSGRVLITSRNQLWPPGQAVDVPVLDTEVAAEFLVGRTGDPDRQAALELAGELGGLPLALEQAAAHVQATGDTLAAYLASYRQRRADLLGRGEPTGYPGTVATTCRLAFGDLQETAPGAAGLLRLLAFCAPEAIPLRLVLHPRPGLAGLGEQVAPVLAPLLEDPLAAGDAIAALRRYSLISPPADGSVSVHRLVQAVTADQMPAELASQWRQAAAVLIEAAIPDETYPRGTWPACAALLPHALAALDLTSGGMWRIANYLGQSGSYSEARDLFRLIADAHTKDDTYGAEHRDTLAARANVALWTGRAGDAAAARDQFAALLPVEERVLGPEHPNTLVARSSLALWTGEAGDAAAARDLYAALLPVEERVLGPEHLDTLSARANLALWTGEAGDPAAARDQFAALLPVEERVLGAEHPDTLTTRANLARLTGQAGDAAAARDLYAALLPIYERVLGPEHPRTLAARDNLARWTGEAGDPAAARDQFAALLPIRERVLGPEHPDTLTTRSNLAYWTGEAGDPARDQFAALLATVFRHAVALDVDGYAYDVAVSLSSLEAALNAGRLPCHPALVERSRDLALLATCLWRLTSPDSPVHRRLMQVEIPPPNAQPEPEEAVPSQPGPEQLSVTRRPRSHPQAEGARLETGVLGIFERLFQVDDDDALRLRSELRRQRSGTQFGADIIFRATAIDSSSTCLVECKNYSSSSSGLPVSVVADKVLQAEANFDAEPVDHWILVSPEVDPNNELDRLVQRWNSTQRFPFTIQIWSPQSGIRDLFAVQPAIYRGLYGEDPPQTRADPNDVLAVFSERLLPPVRLPARLAKYVKDRDSFVESNERLWLDQLDSQIERFGFDENGARLTRSLEAEIISVLCDSPMGSNVALLLAEFGEGKSFFTVSLCCHLQARYLREPRAESPIPIRLFLRDYRHVQDPNEFLHRQLELIGLGMEEWSELRRKNVLVILDGMDEMSVRQDPATTRSNLEKIGSLLEFLAGLPVLITSRPQFFSSASDRERFYDRLRRPHVFRMGQPGRRDTVAHLRAYADSLDLAPKLNKIKELYDPIGLAGKVLFLEMIKKTLPELPEDHFDELVLYETYIRGSLQRKAELLRDPDLTMNDAELREQLESLLEKIAVAIHVSGEGIVDLRKFVSDYGGAAQLLWRSSQVDALHADNEDASVRIGGRSLLRRVDQESSQDGEHGWLVDFFHRSMKEYFVAKALQRALNAQDPFAATRDLLIKTPIQPEIVGFFKLLAHGDEGAATVLASLAHAARVGSGQEILGGGAISLYCAIGGPTKGSEWRSLQLDGAILAGADFSKSDFRGSTLRGVDFSSTDLTGADLRQSDLTDANLDAGDNIIAFRTDLAPHRYICLTQESRLGRITVNADGSLKSSFVPLPRALQWPRSLYILEEDVVLITTDSEFVIVEFEGVAAEEVAHFRISSDLRSATIVDRSFLGLLVDSEREMSAALLVDIRSAEIVWRIPVLPDEGICGWFREGIVIAYNTDVVIYRADAYSSTIGVNFRVSGRSLSVSDEAAIAVTDDGRVAWLPMDGSAEAETVSVHSGAGTALIGGSRDVLSAGSDGSVALTRRDEAGRAVVIARLERRLQCAGALVEELKSDRELAIFLANGADNGGASVPS